MLSLFASPLGPHGEKVTKTGAWQIPTHFRYHLDNAYAMAIAKLVQGDDSNATLLDVGAGKGLYVRYWRGYGLAAQGIEGAPNIERLTGGYIHEADLSAPLPECRRYDWVTCLEVAEHVPRTAELTLLSNLNCSARRGLIISWPPPGQYGTGHVNLRPKRYVLQLLKNFSWVPDSNATRFVSAQANMYWFKENTLVMRRPDAPPFAAPSAAVASPASHDAGALQALRSAVVQMSVRLAEAEVRGSQADATEAELALSRISLYDVEHDRGTAS